MVGQDLEHVYHGMVHVGVCFDCTGIWFDHLTSMQLAPAAVIELFREIHAHEDASRRPYADQLSCPRCTGPLTLSYDLSKAGRFSYFKCPHDEGRFTLFFQFLREKQFVRSLTSGELQRVRSEVRQIKCSQCGAPIDLEHTSECQYCHALVSFLDPEAVHKATSMWTEAAHRREAGHTVQAQDRAQQQRAARSAVASISDLLLARADPDAGAGLDLVALGIRAIGRLLG
jgi:hypothetical protein